MPTNIRVMVWNIRKFGSTVTAIPGMLDVLSKIIRGANPDILIILEVNKVNGPPGLQALCQKLRLDDQAHDWRGFRSYDTGGERYGFVLRDVNLVRMLQATPELTSQSGKKEAPLRNVESVRYDTYPVNFGTPLPAQFPNILPQPLVGLFYDVATKRRPPKKKQKRQRAASVQTLANGGYNLGNGARLPCLAVFHIRTPAGTDCYLPILVNHYAAAWSSSNKNMGAIAQITETPLLHIAQKFAHRNGHDQTVSGYVDIDDAPVLIQELMFAGDWNVDFQINRTVGSAAARANRQAFNQLTPTQQYGGSLPIPLPAPLPAYIPGTNPGVVQGPGGADPVLPPAVPFDPPDTARLLTWIPRQYLTAGVTTQGTILYQASPPETFQASLALVQVAQHTWELHPVAFDLYFFAGRMLNSAQILTPAGALFPASAADAAEVVDIPARIDPVGFAGPIQPGHFKAGLLQNYFAVTAGAPVHAADWAASLNIAGQPLTLTDRWLGAQMVSDHLPVVVEFTVP